MPDLLKSPEEFTRLIKQFTRNLFEISLVTLECQENIFALKSSLFSLDSRARKMFEDQLVIEHGKNQARRDELRTLLETMQKYFPEKLN
jgi:hypothetical protein